MRHHRIETCPHEYARGVSELFAAYDLYESHVMPVSGGWLDQTQVFLDAVKFIEGEKVICQSHGD